MRVPGVLLNQTVTVEPFLGNTAYGPDYGPKVKMRARVEGKRRMVRRVAAGSDVGTDVISTASVTVRPTVDIRAESKITIPNPVTGADQSCEVMEVITGQGLNRPAYLELLVG